MYQVQEFMSQNSFYSPAIRAICSFKILVACLFLVVVQILVSDCLWLRRGYVSIQGVPDAHLSPNAYRDLGFITPAIEQHLNQDVVSYTTETHSITTASSVYSITTGHARRHRNASAKAKFPRSRDIGILAIGSYHSRTSGQVLTHLSEILSASVAWNRRFVVPKVSQGYIIGMAGPNGLRLPANKTSHRPLSSKWLWQYFDPQPLRSPFQRNNLDIVSDKDAAQSCRHNWTLVYISHSLWNDYPLYCIRQALGNVSRVRTPFAAKRKPTSAFVELDDCSWIEECLPTRMKNLRPFRRIVCAGVSKLESFRHDLVSFGQKVFAKDRCVLVVDWLGSEAHGLLPPQLMRIKERHFLPSTYLQSLADKIVSGFQADYGRFVGLHVNTVFLELACNAVGVPCRREWWRAFYLTCISSLKRRIRRLKKRTPILMVTMDTEHDKRTVEIQDRLAEFANSTNVLRSSLQLNHALMNSSNFRQYLSAKEAEVLETDLVSKDIVQTAILATAAQVFVLGGRGFQTSILAIRQARGQASFKDRGFCFVP